MMNETDSEDSSYDNLQQNIEAELLGEAKSMLKGLREQNEIGSPHRIAFSAISADGISKEFFYYLNTNKLLVWFVAVGIILSINGDVELVIYIGDVAKAILVGIFSTISSLLATFICQC